jgi:glucan phosphoethanolaminetransferase (alkaline phosphatase superfamily)
MNKNIIGYLLVVLALFLGIIPHGKYCELLSKVNVKQCPSTEMASVFAFVVFALAVLMCQYDQLSKFLPNAVTSMLSRI